MRALQLLLLYACTPTITLVTIVPFHVHGFRRGVLRRTATIASLKKFHQALVACHLTRLVPQRPLP